jgi:hypothetical protein
LLWGGGLDEVVIVAQGAREAERRPNSVRVLRKMTVQTVWLYILVITVRDVIHDTSERKPNEACVYVGGLAGLGQWGGLAYIRSLSV